MSADSERPHFISKAWPLRPPEGLTTLVRANPNAVIGYRVEFGNKVECSGCIAADYLAEIEDRIKRQAEGFFTVYEAAHVLAQSQQGTKASEWTKDMQEAHRTGALAIRHRDSRAPMRPCNPHPQAVIPALWTAHQDPAWRFLDLVLIADINDWLRAKQVGYLFPELEGDQAQQSAQAAPEALQRSRAQENAILDAIRGAGHEPKSIPKNPSGKPGVKAEIRKQVAKQHPSLFLPKSKIFDKAWERLRSSGDIEDREG